MLTFLAELSICEQHNSLHGVNAPLREISAIGKIEVLLSARYLLLIDDFHFLKMKPANIASCAIFF